MAEIKTIRQQVEEHEREVERVNKEVHDLIDQVHDLTTQANRLCAEGAGNDQSQRFNYLLIAGNALFTAALALNDAL